MKQITKILTAIAALTLLHASSALTQIVDTSTAHTVADNWITTIINVTGKWGDSPKAFVTDVVAFRRGDRVLGYFCQVDPKGHILVSLIEGMPPIKAYSETSAMDPASDEGPADLLKAKMGSALDFIEQRAGDLRAATRADLERIPELDRFDSWQQLKAGPISTDRKIDPVYRGGDYQEGQVLIQANWHQGDPYYRYCPAPPPGSECTAPHCAVGCVATAAAMILRYWSFPNDRAWLDMPDAMEINPTAAEIQQVAALSHDLGVAVAMDYCGLGGCGSGATTSDMKAVYRSIGYTAASGPYYRSDYAQGEWYSKIVDNINQNRPVQYRILGHSIICDGWRYFSGRELHMNYGWANSYNAWYFVDDLYQVKPEGSPDDEYIIDRIVPYGALGSSISGEYAYSSVLPIRYVDRDCNADAVTFNAGMFIQFHPRKVLRCNSDHVYVYGSPSANTALFAGETSNGIKINSGYILMYPGAEMELRLDRPD